MANSWSVHFECWQVLCLSNCSTNAGTNDSHFSYSSPIHSHNVVHIVLNIGCENYKLFLYKHAGEHFVPPGGMGLRNAELRKIKLTKVMVSVLCWSTFHVASMLFMNANYCACVWAHVYVYRMVCKPLTWTLLQKDKRPHKCKPWAHTYDKTVCLQD